MSRRRSASLSRPAFEPSADFQDADALDALALAGRDGPRSRSNSLALDDVRLESTTSMRVGCEVQVQVERTRPYVRVARRPSRLAPPLGSRPAPKRSMTRMVPLTVDELDDTTSAPRNPLDDDTFREGLRLAGYLQDLDTSRKTIKGRFSHALQKEQFKDNLDAFLETQQVKARGEYMIRFQGPPAEAHSPYVHLFVTSLPSSTSTCKVYPDSASGADASLTTWTHLTISAPATSEWAAKARKFWPVRVQLEGPSATDLVPTLDDDGTVDPRLRRRVRRDTFQQGVDLDAELKKREEKQAIELRDNTERNALRAAASPALTLDTTSSNTRRSGSSKKGATAVGVEAGDAPATPTGDQRAAQSPSTPTSPSVLAAVKLLGESIVADPRVQSLTDTVSRGATGLREWFAARALPAPFEAEVEDEEAERERRKRDKERRRRKTEERRKREEEEGLGVEEDDLQREREERRLRKDERRRRRAAEEGQ